MDGWTDLFMFCTDVVLKRLMLSNEMKHASNINSGDWPWDQRLADEYATAPPCSSAVQSSISHLPPQEGLRLRLQGQ